MGRCARNLSIAFNVVFLLIGIAILAIGGWVRVNFRSFQQTVGDASAHLVSNFDIVLIVIGSITTLVAFVGCYGSVKKNRCFLVLFIIIMILMIVGEMTGLIFMFAFTDDFRRIVSQSAKRTIKSDYGTSTVAGVSASEGWDFAQKTFVCCGFDSGDDYIGSEYASTHGFTNPWPESCCLRTGGTFVDLDICRNGPSPIDLYYHTSGCAERIINVALAFAPLVGAVVGVTMFIQLLAVVFSVIIFRDSKKNRVSSDD